MSNVGQRLSTGGLTKDGGQQLLLAVRPSSSPSVNVRVADNASVATKTTLMTNDSALTADMEDNDDAMSDDEDPLSLSSDSDDSDDPGGVVDSTGEDGVYEEEASSESSDGEAPEPNRQSGTNRLTPAASALLRTRGYISVTELYNSHEKVNTLLYIILSSGQQKV